MITINSLETNLHKTDVAIKIYCKENKQEWDNFILGSKNGVFLFFRDYMDYHSNRFFDHSLMIYNNGKLVGLLPANADGNVLCSHGGLTFGGIITNKMPLTLILKIFESLKDHCLNVGFRSIQYKTIPYIYHSIPCDQDLYALFLNHAKLVGRNASSCIYLPNKKRFKTKRIEAIKKAKNNGLIVRQSFDFSSFIKLVGQVVYGRHGVNPVHSASEMSLLATRFPQNIKLFCSYKNDVMLAGCLIYESTNVAHGQYAANSDLGRQYGAQDVILDFLINDYYKDKKYFDFGISTTTNGWDLNTGLVAHKESFGATPIMYDTYNLPLNS